MEVDGFRRNHYHYKDDVLLPMGARGGTFG
jgi:hypothetical protein